MRERWMLDRARDRLIVTRAMMQQLHDKVRFGLLQPEQAEVASALILAQIEQAISLVEDASRSLRGQRAGAVEPRAAEASAVQPAAVAIGSAS